MHRIKKFTFSFFALALTFACLFFALYFLPARASLLYGPPASHLSISSRIEYSTRLLMHGSELKTPFQSHGAEQTFRVESGEAVSSIAVRLQDTGLISNAQAFYDYAVYTGIDLTIQTGEFQLSPDRSIIEIAQVLQKFSPSDATLVILPGWRMEEIAASLPTSGLNIPPDSFLAASAQPPEVLAFASPSTMEGFFFPDTYTLPRETTSQQLMQVIARNFAQHLTEDLLTGFQAQGLTVYQAVTLASIIEREAIQPDESPLIASVYLNRLAIGMKLDADPTVQYAAGYNLVQMTWWTNPISTMELQLASPFNTYLYAGLPPSPISNPGLDALYAVAAPQPSGYYYFRARCDNSGYHIFAVTLEEQIANACP